MDSISKSELPPILIVDDHDDTVRVMVRLLNRNGFTAFGALGVAEALLTWSRERCGILIADIALNDGSGSDLMRSLLPGGARGISISGLIDVDEERQNHEAGFEVCLLKPIAFTDLLSAIDVIAQPRRRSARKAPSSSSSRPSRLESPESQDAPAAEPPTESCPSAPFLN